MRDTLIDPLVAERLERDHSNKFARVRGWEAHPMRDPVDDLQLFFDSLSGTKILDVACGWGRYVYRFIDHDLDYTGIDHSAEMLKHARSDNPGQRFEEMSYRDLSFADNTFDGLWCCCAFSGEPKHSLPTVLAELKRVLKHGGSMVIVMPCVHGSVDELAKDADGKDLIWYSSYELEELCEIVAASGLTFVDSIWRPECGSMTVHFTK